MRALIGIIVLTAAASLSLPAGPAVADFDTFWPQFQAAVAKHDAKAVAGMMQFPLDWELGKVRKIQSAAEFIAGFDRYVPADMVKAVATVKPVHDPGGEYTIDWKKQGLECTLFFKKDNQGNWMLEALAEGSPMAP